MHPDTNFHNNLGAAIKWHETIQNMSFRPKVVDWVCLLQKTRNRSRGINLCIKCTSIPIFCNVSSAATEWHGTTQNLSFRPEIVDWACSL